MRTFFAWLVRNRTSPRAAFSLRMVCMAASVILSLVWTRALLHGLGQYNFGLLSSFSAFLAIASAALLSACKTFSPDGGMGTVATIAGQGLNKPCQQRFF